MGLINKDVLKLKSGFEVKNSYITYHSQRIVDKNKFIVDYYIYKSINDYYNGVEFIEENTIELPFNATIQGIANINQLIYLAIKERYNNVEDVLFDKCPEFKYLNYEITDNKDTSLIIHAECDTKIENYIIQPTSGMDITNFSTFKQDGKKCIFTIDNVLNIGTELDKCYIRIKCKDMKASGISFEIPEFLPYRKKYYNW